MTSVRYDPSPSAEYPSLVQAVKKWWRGRQAHRRQRTFIYCPTCRFEMVAGGEWLGQDIETGDEGYRCNRCRTLSTWDFDAPAPLLVSTEPDEAADLRRRLSNTQMVLDAYKGHHKHFHPTCDIQGPGREASA